MKQINYFNLEFFVDSEFNWIAYDKDGEIQLFKNKPVFLSKEGFWEDEDDNKIHLLGNRVRFTDAKNCQLSLLEI